ncbi:MAG: hydroxyisourate hydrolase [Gammaproteobacteria bacterium]|nr:MAG: hydroxyisourate hydrolase [Gammaproteobacteria bacterium]UCH38504.1 MAG: hydroxyisourate hydrolase [Gammaproteobacteria bacterium]
MGRLTTHVLDTAQGCPASGVAVLLYRVKPERELIAEASTNADGRLDAPILDDAAFASGVYELVFQAGKYFAAHLGDLPDPPFVDEVVIRFGIANPDQHYHVPLLVSPWSYSTYRGS